MTIEAKIEELTAAITELTAAIYGSAGVVGSKEQPDVPKPVSPEKEKPAAKAKAEPKKALAPSDAQEDDTAKPSPVEYNQVRDKVLDLIKADPNNRAKVLEALEPFGVDTAKALKPEQYADALKKLNEIKVA